MASCRRTDSPKPGALAQGTRPIRPRREARNDNGPAPEGASPWLGILDDRPQRAAMRRQTSSTLARLLKALMRK